MLRCKSAVWFTCNESGQESSSHQDWWRIEHLYEFCEHDVSCASGTLFSYLNCSLLFSAVPCSLHLKANYSCPHKQFSFRSDGESVCQVFAHLATWWCRCGILVFAFFLTIDRKKRYILTIVFRSWMSDSRRRWKSLSEERGIQYRQINSN